MSDKLKLSGYAYKKLREEKKRKETDNLSKNTKITSFFSNNQVSTQNTSGQEKELSNLTENFSAIDHDSCIVPLAQETEEKSPKVLPSLENLDSSKERDILPQQNFDLTDPASWKKDDDTINRIIHKPPTQKLDEDFSKSKRQYNGPKEQTRLLQKSYFFSELPNGKKVQRDWLLYSKSTGKVFCIPCRLFSKGSTSLSNEGFNDWKHAENALSSHERSSEHRNNQLTLIIQHQKNSTIDSELKKQYGLEKEYWRKVFHRLINVVKFLASRGLAFQGSNQHFGSIHNGNYLGLLELIAKFDEFLAKHIQKYGNPGKGNTSYLSTTICDEIIQLLGTAVRESIINEIKEAEYFSIIVDSTPDIAHTDQLTIIFRFVNSFGRPIERFLKFIPIFSHKGESLADVVVKMLENNGLDVKKCRGQCYDNAANMSGCYTGLQARLKQLNNLALYVPCTNHSLNLVGCCAAECCSAAIHYFMFLENLYTFFSASPIRWKKMNDSLSSTTFSEIEKIREENTESETQSDILEAEENESLWSKNEEFDDNCGTGQKRHRSLVLKKLCDTRWSARYDASFALSKGFNAVQDCLLEMSQDDLLNAATRHEASALHKKLNQNEIAFMIILWTKILERVNATNKTLQSVDINLHTAVDLYWSLEKYLQTLRNESFQELYDKVPGMTKNDWKNENVSRRPRKRKRFFDESMSEETTFDTRQKMEYECFNPILDNFINELKRRRDAYSQICNMFGFLLNLENAEKDCIMKASQSLVENYPDDLNDQLGEECLQFREFLQNIQLKTTKALPAGLILEKVIVEKRLIASFPNIYTALKIFTTIPVSNATGERSFSALKRIKNYLRSSLSQWKLNSLAVIGIEHELLESISVDDIADKFSSLKARRQII